jgi:hypothetical protein
MHCAMLHASDTCPKGGAPPLQLRPEARPEVRSCMPTLEALLRQRLQRQECVKTHCKLYRLHKRCSRFDRGADLDFAIVSVLAKLGCSSCLFNSNSMQCWACCNQTGTWASRLLTESALIDDRTALLCVNSMGIPMRLCTASSRTCWLSCCWYSSLQSVTCPAVAEGGAQHNLAAA